MTLTVGRFTIDAPMRWDDSYSGRRKQERLRGELNGSTLAATKALRKQMLHQVGEVIPILFSDDGTRDGFYRLIDVNIDADDYYLNSTGLFEFSITVELVGTYSSTEFQGLVTNNLVANDHGLIRSEVNFWHAPPIGALGRTVGDTTGNTGEITRTGADGALNVAVGIPDTSPKWTISPSAFYDGGCYVKVGGNQVAGTHTELDADDWEIGNSLVKVTPGLTTSASDGTIDVTHYNGSWGTAKDYEILYATTTRVTEWPKMKVLANTPEYACIELMEDANEAGGNKYTRHTMTLWVRRGGLMVMGYYHYDGAATTWTIQRATAEAATAVQPTGSTPSDMAVRASANDSPDGNRYIIGSAATGTIESTQGGLDFTSRQGFDFFISSEIDGSTAQTQDTADKQCLQYLADTSEQVRPVP